VAAFFAAGLAVFLAALAAFFAGFFTATSGLSFYSLRAPPDAIRKHRGSSMTHPAIKCTCVR
jgi:hypothetical protein